MRLGLIAGKGDIPRLIAENKRQAGEPIFVVGIKGQDEAWIQEFPHKICGIAEAGNVIRALKSAECDTVSMIGNITRPDFTRLKPDLKAVSILPRLVKAATKGDDSLLRVLVEMFEEEGFDVVGAETLLSNLKGESGLLSQCAPSETDIADIRKCYDVAGEVGRLDIGQGAVVARGLVLAVEAQEGTDEMLRRVAKLPEAIRGTEDQRCGVLVKRPKPDQERRVDLPTIGPSTVRLAAEAGLSAIAFIEGGALIVNRSEIQQLADAFKISVIGLTADGQLP